MADYNNISFKPYEETETEMKKGVKTFKRNGLPEEKVYSTVCFF